MSWLIRDRLRSQPTRQFLQNLIRRDPASLSVAERAASAAFCLNKWDEEIIPSYKPESYYPAQLDETLNGTYKLIAKIGFGTTSTMWLAEDARRWWWQPHFVALKILVNALSPELVGSEVAISKHISKSSTLHPGRQLVRMHTDTFSLQGPNGVHPVLIYDLMREPLYVFRERYVGQRFEPDTLKRLLGFVLTGLDYLHNECHVVHGDLNTENIMIPMEDRADLYQFVCDGFTTPLESVREQPDGRDAYLSLIAGDIDSIDSLGPPKIIDFGASTIINESGHCAPRTQLTRYKAPELLLGAPFGYSADIWSLGLMVWELLESQSLLEVCDPTNGVRTEQTQLAEIIGLLGPPPESLRSRGSKSDLFFDPKGTPLALFEDAYD